jgi:hypothetical protein
MRGDLTVGLRFDYAKYPTATFNQLVFDELAIRTDNKLSQQFFNQENCVLGCK